MTDRSLPSDRELIDGIRSGDAATLARLQAAYWGPLLRFAAGILDGNADPQDVVQEAFIRLWTHREWSATGPNPLSESDRGRPVDPVLIVAAAEERRRGAERGAVSLTDRRASRLSRVRWSLAAAAAVVAVALGIRGGLPDRALEPLATYAAEAGVARSVSLDDGSFVRLAPGSSL